MPLPVVVLTTIDPVLRDAALFGMLTDLPGTGVLRQDLDPGAGTLRRVISDADGRYEDDTVPLAHTCLGCAIREDSLPSLQRMVDSGRWERIVLALPVSAGPAPAVQALALPDTARDVGVQIAGLVAAVDTDTVVEDLLGTDLLDERGLALADDDRRSVGEALVAQVRHADLVLSSGSNAVGSALVDQVRAAGTDRHDLFETGGPLLFRRRYHHSTAERRIDPRTVEPSGRRPREGVWTLDLQSSRPLHPGRFVERIEELGADRVWSRGRFRLASRPHRICEWDGAGGQVSLGDAGAWLDAAGTTRLIFTGAGGANSEKERQWRLGQVFRDVCLTDAELARDPLYWLTFDDGLDPWLGERSSVA